jgi:F0F1-type ATP synthase membrane subunit b/b'
LKYGDDLVKKGGDLLASAGKTTKETTGKVKAEVKKKTSELQKKAEAKLQEAKEKFLGPSGDGNGPKPDPDDHNKVKDSGELETPDQATNPKIYAQLEKQLERGGAKSIKKALKSAEKTLKEHEDKLPGLQYKSQVEGTIDNVKKQIETIKKFIKDKDL